MTASQVLPLPQPLPPQPTVCDPRRHTEVAAAAVKVLAEASTALAGIRHAGDLPSTFEIMSKLGLAASVMAAAEYRVEPILRCQNAGPMGNYACWNVFGASTTSNRRRVESLSVRSVR
jgi:hypothetical protein